MDSSRILVDVMQDLSPLHTEIDQLHHSLGLMLNDSNLTADELVSAMRKGRNELAKVALKERHVLAEHAMKTGVSRSKVPLAFLGSMWSGESSQLKQLTSHGDGGHKLESYPSTMIATTAPSNQPMGISLQTTPSSVLSPPLGHSGDRHNGGRSPQAVQHIHTPNLPHFSNYARAEERKDYHRSAEKTLRRQAPPSILASSIRDRKGENIPSHSVLSSMISAPSSSSSSSVSSSKEMTESKNELKMQKRSLRTLRKHILAQIQMQEEVLDLSGVGSSEGSAGVRALKTDLAKVEVALSSLGRPPQATFTSPLHNNEDHTIEQRRYATPGLTPSSSIRVTNNDIYHGSMGHHGLTPSSSSSFHDRQSIPGLRSLMHGISQPPKSTPLSQPVSETKPTTTNLIDKHSPIDLNQRNDADFVDDKEEEVSLSLDSSQLAVAADAFLQNMQTDYQTLNYKDNVPPNEDIDVDQSDPSSASSSSICSTLNCGLEPRALFTSPPQLPPSVSSSISAATLATSPYGSIGMSQKEFSFQNVVLASLEEQSSREEDDQEQDGEGCDHHQLSEVIVKGSEGSSQVCQPLKSPFEVLGHGEDDVPSLASLVSNDLKAISVTLEVSNDAEISHATGDDKIVHILGSDQGKSPLEMSEREKEEIMEQANHDCLIGEKVNIIEEDNEDRVLNPTSIVCETVVGGSNKEDSVLNPTSIVCEAMVGGSNKEDSVLNPTSIVCEAMVGGSDKEDRVLNPTSIVCEAMVGGSNKEDSVCEAMVGGSNKEDSLLNPTSIVCEAMVGGSDKEDSVCEAMVGGSNKEDVVIIPEASINSERANRFQASNHSIRDVVTIGVGGSDDDAEDDETDEIVVVLYEEGKNSYHKTGDVLAGFETSSSKHSVDEEGEEDIQLKDFNCSALMPSHMPEYSIGHSSTPNSTSVLKETEEKNDSIPFFKNENDELDIQNIPPPLDMSCLSIECEDDGHEENSRIAIEYENDSIDFEDDEYCVEKEIKRREKPENVYGENINSNQKEGEDKGELNPKTIILETYIDNEYSHDENDDTCEYLTHSIDQSHSVKSSNENLLHSQDIDDVNHEENSIDRGDSGVFAMLNENYYGPNDCDVNSSSSHNHPPNKSMNIDHMNTRVNNNQEGIAKKIDFEPFALPNNGGESPGMPSTCSNEQAECFGANANSSHAQERRGGQYRKVIIPTDFSTSTSNLECNDNTPSASHVSSLPPFPSSAASSSSASSILLQRSLSDKYNMDRSGSLSPLQNHCHAASKTVDDDDDEQEEEEEEKVIVNGARHQQTPFCESKQHLKQLINSEVWNDQQNKIDDHLVLSSTDLTITSPIKQNDKFHCYGVDNSHGEEEGVDGRRIVTSSDDVMGGQSKNVYQQLPTLVEEDSLSRSHLNDGESSNEDSEVSIQNVNHVFQAQYLAQLKKEMKTELLSKFGIFPDDAVYDDDEEESEYYETESEYETEYDETESEYETESESEDSTIQYNQFLVCDDVEVEQELGSDMDKENMSPGYPILSEVGDDNDVSAILDFGINTCRVVVKKHQEVSINDHGTVEDENDDVSSNESLEYSLDAPSPLNMLNIDTRAVPTMNQRSMKTTTPFTAAPSLSGVSLGLINNEQLQQQEACSNHEFIEIEQGEEFGSDDEEDYDGISELPNIQKRWPLDKASDDDDDLQDQVSVSSQPIKQELFQEVLKVAESKSSTFRQDATNHQLHHFDDEKKSQMKLDESENELFPLIRSMTNTFDQIWYADEKWQHYEEERKINSLSNSDDKCTIQNERKDNFHINEHKEDTGSDDDDNDDDDVIDVKDESGLTGFETDQGCSSSDSKQEEDHEEELVMKENKLVAPPSPPIPPSPPTPPSCLSNSSQLAHPPPSNPQSSFSNVTNDEMISDDIATNKNQMHNSITASQNTSFDSLIQKILSSSRSSAHSSISNSPNLSQNGNYSFNYGEPQGLKNDSFKVNNVDELLEARVHPNDDDEEEVDKDSYHGSEEECDEEDEVELPSHSSLLAHDFLTSGLSAELGVPILSHRHLLPNQSSPSLPDKNEFNELEEGEVSPSAHDEVTMGSPPKETESHNDNDDDEYTLSVQGSVTSSVPPPPPSSSLSTTSQSPHHFDLENQKHMDKIDHNYVKEEEDKQEDEQEEEEEEEDVSESYDALKLYESIKQDKLNHFKDSENKTETQEFNFMNEFKNEESGNIYNEDEEEYSSNFVESTCPSGTQDNTELKDYDYCDDSSYLSPPPSPPPSPPSMSKAYKPQSSSTTSVTKSSNDGNNDGEVDSRVFSLDRDGRLSKALESTRNRAVQSNVVRAKKESSASLSHTNVVSTEEGDDEDATRHCSLTPRRKKIPIVDKDVAWFDKNSPSSSSNAAASKLKSSEQEDRHIGEKEKEEVQVESKSMAISSLFGSSDARVAAVVQSSTGATSNNSASSSETTVDGSGPKLTSSTLRPPIPPYSSPLRSHQQPLGGHTIPCSSISSPITSPSWQRRNPILASLSPIAPNSNFKRSCGTLEQILEQWNDHDDDEEEVEEEDPFLKESTDELNRGKIIHIHGKQPKVSNTKSKNKTSSCSVSSSSSATEGKVSTNNHAVISNERESLEQTNSIKTRLMGYESPKRRRSSSPTPSSSSLPLHHMPLYPSSASSSIDAKKNSLNNKDQYNENLLNESPSKKMKKNENYHLNPRKLFEENEEISKSSKNSMIMDSENDHHRTPIVSSSSSSSSSNLVSLSPAPLNLLPKKLLFESNSKKGSSSLNSNVENSEANEDNAKSGAIFTLPKLMVSGRKQTLVPLGSLSDSNKTNQQGSIKNSNKHEGKPEEEIKKRIQSNGFKIDENESANHSDGEDCSLSMEHDVISELFSAQLGQLLPPSPPGLRRKLFSSSSEEDDDEDEKENQDIEASHDIRQQHGITEVFKFGIHNEIYKSEISNDEDDIEEEDDESLLYDNGGYYQNYDPSEGYENIGMTTSVWHTETTEAHQDYAKKEGEESTEDDDDYDDDETEEGNSVDYHETRPHSTQIASNGMILSNYCSEIIDNAKNRPSKLQGPQVKENSYTNESMSTSPFQRNTKYEQAEDGHLFFFSDLPSSPSQPPPPPPSSSFDSSKTKTPQHPSPASLSINRQSPSSLLQNYREEYRPRSASPRIKRQSQQLNRPTSARQSSRLDKHITSTTVGGSSKQASLSSSFGPTTIKKDKSPATVGGIYSSTPTNHIASPPLQASKRSPVSDSPSSLVDDLKLHQASRSYQSRYMQKVAASTSSRHQAKAKF